MNIEKYSDKTFFGLLVNPKAPFSSWGSTWFNLKRSIYYFKRFFYDIWWFRGSDKGYTLNLLETALKEQLKTISAPGKLQERDKERIPKEESIKRCIEILRNIDEDNYAERCGYDYNYDLFGKPVKGSEEYFEIISTTTKEQDVHNDISLKEGAKLADDEFNELMDLLSDPKKGLRTWWR